MCANAVGNVLNVDCVEMLVVGGLLHKHLVVVVT